MKTTGFQLQQRIKELKRDVEMYATQFENGKMRFEDENKPTAKEAYLAYRQCEDKLANYQTAQTYYNMHIMVKVGNETITLAQAIKLVGGAGRGEAMWRGIVAPKKDRYGRDTTTRSTEEVRAQPTYTMEEARQFAQDTANFASDLRYAIQMANAQEMDIPMDKL